MYKRNGIYYADFVHEGKRYVRSLKVSSKSIAKELEQRFKVEIYSGEYARKQKRKKQDIRFELNRFAELKHNQPAEFFLSSPLIIIF